MEMKKCFININDLCNTIKRINNNIYLEIKNIDRLGKSINIDKYVEFLQIIVKTTKELQEFNMIEYKK